MNTKILGLLAASLIAPILAQADTITLDYQGYVMGGTSTVLPANWDMPGGGAGPIAYAQQSTVSTTATLDAQIVYSGSVAQNNLSVVSVQVDLSGNNGTPFGYLNLGAGDLAQFVIQEPGGGLCYTESVAVGGCATLTTSGNAVTGATIQISSDWYHDSLSEYTFNIGPNGDSFSLGTSEEAFSCAMGPAYVTYVGATPNNNAPCNINVSNPTAGVWTTVSPAPEVDSAAATTALALLFGSLAVMRGAGVGRNFR